MGEMAANKKIKLKYALEAMPNKINTTEMEFENLPWKVESITSYGAVTD